MLPSSLSRERVYFLMGLITRKQLLNPDYLQFERLSFLQIELFAKLIVGHFFQNMLNDNHIPCIAYCRL